MCGISAVIGSGPDVLSLVGPLNRMHQMLSHRGPDGEGSLWIDSDMNAFGTVAGGVGPPATTASWIAAAAFRWLRVQDLNPLSGQPMGSGDKKQWLLFNGAIYNYRNLRGELSRCGAIFRTDSDTEVVLEAYRIWGVKCFSRFRGMWAILLFDVARRCVLLSRDRLGIKPLFYSWDKRRLLVASEAQAVALASAEKPPADAFRVHEFLRGLPPQSDQLTFFEKVRPVPAASWVEIPLDAIEGQELRFQRYWNLGDYHGVDIPEDDFLRTREEFEALLVEVVKEHANAAVEVGALLSGGLDSSLIASLLARVASTRAKAFSVIYQDPQMSEWPYIQLVLAKAGLKGMSYVLTPETAWLSTESVVRSLGRPLLGQDFIAQYHAYALAKHHRTTVVLDGQGPDELLGGLSLYEAEIFPEMLRRGQWIRFGAELRARMRRYQMSLTDALTVYLRAPLARKRMEDRGLPRYEWLNEDSVDSAASGPGRTSESGPEKSALARYLYRKVRHTNLPTVLLAQDHISMGHAIESRVPYLDHRLVEFIFGLPERFKLHNGVRKRILLETGRNYLPSTIIQRRDKRMFVSDASWMHLRQNRASELREMAASTEMQQFGLINTSKMKSFVTDYLAGKHNEQAAVWRLYTLWHWIRLFCPSI